MINEHFERIVKRSLDSIFRPRNRRQWRIFSFLFDRHPPESLFYWGYAGTGKTSLVAAIVNTLLQFEQQVVLLAPTEAAKVFSSYSHQPALRYIKDLPAENAQEEVGIFNLGFNGNANTLFRGWGIHDLNGFSVRILGRGLCWMIWLSSCTTGGNNRLVIGDTAQLPHSIGVDVKSGLGGWFLQGELRMEIYEATWPISCGSRNNPESCTMLL